MSPQNLNQDHIRPLTRRAAVLAHEYARLRGRDRPNARDCVCAADDLGASWDAVCCLWGWVRSATSADGLPAFEDCAYEPAGHDDRRCILRGIESVSALREFLALTGWNCPPVELPFTNTHRAGGDRAGCNPTDALGGVRSV